MEQRPIMLALSERIYRCLLYLYPAGHRREYGPEMVQLFHDLSRQTYQQSQASGMFALWIRLLPDLGVSVGVEHLSELKGIGMRKFCVRANLDPALSYSIVVSAIVLALGTLAMALVTRAGGSVWAAVAILIAANLAAAAVMEIRAHTRGTAIIPIAILVAATLLPLFWVKDAARWLQGTPTNTIFILMAAYWFASGRGRPAWPVYTVGLLLAAAKVATSLMN